MTETLALKEQLRDIIADVSEIDSIPDAASFEELGIDSMMAVEIVAEVERSLKISINEEELRTLTNLDRVYEVAARELAKSNTKDVA